MDKSRSSCWGDSRVPSRPTLHQEGRECARDGRRRAQRVGWVGSRPIRRRGPPGSQAQTAGGHPHAHRAAPRRATH
eukprot:scaffold147569_cov29-Tisochrysis_lutea.AAC.4